MNSGIHEDGDTGRGRVSTLFQRVFRERELILRSEGRVSYLRLTPRVQKIGAGLCTSVFVWAVAVSGGAYWQNTVIDDKRHEISEAKLAFEQLRDDLATYQEKVAAAATALSARSVYPGADDRISARDLQEFRNKLGVIDDLNIKLSGIVEQMQVDIETPDPERARIIASRQVLHDRIDLLRSTLSETRERETELAVTVTELSSKVDAIRAKEQNVLGERDDLEIRLTELDSQLLESRTRVGDLSRNLRETRTALRETEENHSEASEQRQTLSSRVQVLERALHDARNRGDGLAVQVAALERSLTQAEEARDNATANRENAQASLAHLDARLKSLRDQQEETESRLSDLVSVARRTDQDEDAMSVVLASGPQDTVVVLEEALKDLVAELTIETNNRLRAEATVREVVKDLGQVAGKAELDPVPDPVASAKSLLAQIKGLHETQEQVVAGLINRTDRQIDDARRMFEMAGLEQDQLQALGVAPKNSAQGGPFFALDDFGGTAQHLETSVALLNDKAEEWQDLESMLACTPWIPPVDNYHLTSKFGKRRDPINGRMAMHKGVDLAGWPKTPVYVTAPGVVTAAGRDGKYGKMIEVDHGCGIRTRYAHLHTILVKKGQQVTHRERIGKLGNTGRSTGPHIHYEILIEGKPVDPIKFFEAGRTVFKG